MEKVNTHHTSTRTPEILVPKIGDYLVELGMITPAQLRTALTIQREFKRDFTNLQPPLVGQILLEQGYISQDELDIAITDLIIKLKDALEATNQQLEKRVLERTKELESAIKKINELNANKREFISNISHELRTPMTHILGYTYLLLDGTFGALTNDQSEALDAMKNAANRLEELINDLIGFTEIENDELIIQPTPIAPFELCNKAIRNNRKYAIEKKIHLLMKCEETTPNVIADRDKILWVLRQLINNAIKFTPENGYVMIKTRQIKDSVEFSVTDTGIGIPKESFNEIFEAFHQLDGSTTRKAGGTGIGLTISKEILEAHNSRIEVRSEVNKGSEFRFRLKVSELD
ncbi:MAG: hypothetical protein HPY85_04015 [Anaerolineae bacterium]|nr:hypothetical protein [Anaerolineae bacterium]